MVHGVVAPVVLIPLEEGKVGDPQKIVAPRGDQISLMRDVESERTEG